MQNLTNMIQKTINLYTITELSREAQERAHREYIAGNDYPDLSDDMTEHLKELLETSAIKCYDPKIYYSLSHSQGDGAMFEGECIYRKYFVRVRHLGHYCHSGSKTITVLYDEHFEVPEDVCIEKIEKEIEAEYITICKKLARYGYDWLEENDSFDYFVDLCEMNGDTFTSEGIMENV